MAPTDPVLTVSNLLQDNWAASNTNSTTPNIHTGKYREDEADPQVAVVPQTEVPLNGGDSGYSAIDGSGSGAVQTLGGVIQCDCRDNYDRTDNVKDNLYKIKEEVARLVMQNQLNNDDLRVLAPGETTGYDVTNQEPVRLQTLQPVQYIRDRRP